MSKHTPGPWRFSANLSASEYHQGFSIIGNGWKLADVIPVDSSGIEGQANARLIAAAPELLEQLEKAHDLLSMWHAFVDGSASDELLQIRAAIDKARGHA